MTRPSAPDAGTDARCAVSPDGARAVYQDRSFDLRLVSLDDGREIARRKSEYFKAIRFSRAAVMSWLSTSWQVAKEGVVINLSHKGPNSSVSVQDIIDTGVRLGPDRIPMIYTGWTEKTWGKPEFWSQMPYLEPGVGEYS